MTQIEQKKKQPAGCFAFLRTFSKLFKRKKKQAVMNSEGHAKPKDTEELCSPPPPLQQGLESPEPVSDSASLLCQGQRQECEAGTAADDSRASTQQSPIGHSGTGHEEEASNEEESPVRRYFIEQGLPLLEEQQISQLTNYYQESIGRGSYGWCCRTRVPGTGQEVVVKTFCRDALEDLFTEVSVLQSLQVVGVQRLVGVCVETCQMVTCCAGQIAKDFLASPLTRFKDAVSVCLQVARTLRKIHLRGVAHNDIKANNVCVKLSDQGPIATIIDFGLARTIGSPSVYHPAPACKHPWAAPELLQEDALPCSRESDVYSLAYLIGHTVELRCCSQRCPALHALCQLLRDALEPEPSARPTLPALIRALEELHSHVLAPCSPHPGAG
ncbi:Dual specificity testis-specific protein kinase 2 [Portunus trituberculatus]|uniref:Dual specificity testis-specific protein kinase 2 n=1 Tax=Portunus trituberculatus TaxID=210409 RepID=A0A5B7IA00_PORTR|nr:Dual specificity testis-specific protein kinase 2 [Portunus trituberculatus]